MVQGQKTHMFSIQHDPGNNRYAYMADDIWNISHVGFTKPNPNSIGNVIETLLSLWCLAPAFPELIGQLGMERIKSHTRAWTEDLLATRPSPQPKAKISIKQEELELAGLVPPSSDEEEFQDPQEAPAPVDRKRPAEEEPGAENQEHQRVEAQGQKHTEVTDTVETAPALAGALMGFAASLKETTDRIRSFADQSPRRRTRTVDHPDCTNMERLVVREPARGQGALRRRRTTLSTPSGSLSVTVQEGSLPISPRGRGTTGPRRIPPVGDGAGRRHPRPERPNQLPVHEWTNIKSKMIGHLNSGRAQESSQVPKTSGRHWEISRRSWGSTTGGETDRSQGT